ncbi:hypothetical protein PISMIDRAFT_688978, partial [Pisolithus microcarpus 441]
MPVGETTGPLPVDAPRWTVLIISGYRFSHTITISTLHLFPKNDRAFASLCDTSMDAV